MLEKVPLGVHDRNAHGGVRTTDIEQKRGRAKKAGKSRLVPARKRATDG